MSTVKMVNLRRPNIGVDLNASVCKFGLVNNWEIPISGNPLNPASPTNGTIVFSATSDVDVVATGDVVIVSTTRVADSTFRSHTVVISCANGKSGTIVVKQASKIVSLGNHNGASNPDKNFYTGANGTAPKLTWNLNDAPVNCQKIRQNTGYANILPATGNKAWPVGLTHFSVDGANVTWTYTGAMPVGLLYYRSVFTNFNWTWSGVMSPVLNYLLMQVAGSNWTNQLLGNSSGVKPNITGLQLVAYRPTNMNYDELIPFLLSLINDVGSLPTLVDVRAQIPANVTAIAAASPNETGTDAEKCKYYINLIKSTKGVTTFQLNTTNL